MSKNTFLFPRSWNIYVNTLISQKTEVIIFDNYQTYPLYNKNQLRYGQNKSINKICTILKNDGRQTNLPKTNLLRSVYSWKTQHPYFDLSDNFPYTTYICLKVNMNKESFDKNSYCRATIAIYAIVKDTKYFKWQTWFTFLLEKNYANKSTGNFNF